MYTHNVNVHSLCALQPLNQLLQITRERKRNDEDKTLALKTSGQSSGLISARKRTENRRKEKKLPFELKWNRFAVDLSKLYLFVGLVVAQIVFVSNIIFVRVITNREFSYSKG